MCIKYFLSRTMVQWMRRIGISTFNFIIIIIIIIIIINNFNTEKWEAIWAWSSGGALEKREIKAGQ